MKLMTTVIRCLSTRRMGGKSKKKTLETGIYEYLHSNCSSYVPISHIVPDVRQNMALLPILIDFLLDFKKKRLYCKIILVLKTS